MLFITRSTCAFLGSREGKRQNSLDFHAPAGCISFVSAALGAAGWGLGALGAPVAAGLTHAAAVADGVEEAAVARVARVAAGQLVAQARLLVGDAAPGGPHGPELQGFRQLLGGVLRAARQTNKKQQQQRDIFVYLQAIWPAS